MSPPPSTTLCNNVRRAGVIYFTYNRNDILFLTGVDRTTGDLCDFGGGAKRGETLQEAAAREANEETCGIFGTTIKDIFASVAVFNAENTSVIYFVKLDPLWVTCAELLFTYKQRTISRHIKHHHELVSLRWVDSACFRNIVYNTHNKHMWIKIKTHIRRNIKWYDLLYCCSGNATTYCGNAATYCGNATHCRDIATTNNVCPSLTRITCGGPATNF